MSKEIITVIENDTYYDVFVGSKSFIQRKLVPGTFFPLTAEEQVITAFCILQTKKLKHGQWVSV